VKQSPLTRRKPLGQGKPLRRTDLEASENLVTRKTRERRRPISPASPAQRAAVKGRPCLGCGRYESEYVAIDPAHVWPRGRGGCDSRFCVVPLCRTFDGGCHRLFDEGKLDLLAVMVEDWGRWRLWFVHALRHCLPVQLLERLAGSRISWSDGVGAAWPHTGKREQ
jgi:hypothetical protein